MFNLQELKKEWQSEAHSFGSFSETTGLTMTQVQGLYLVFDCDYCDSLDDEEIIRRIELLQPGMKSGAIAAIMRGDGI